MTSIINNNIKGITVDFMEVPCCSGLVRAEEIAIANSNKDFEIIKIKIGIRENKEFI